MRKQILFNKTYLKLLQNVHRNIKSYRKHDFHLVDPSPWPLVASAAVFCSMIGGVWSMHGEENGLGFLIAGLLLTFLTAYLWWKDVVREGKKIKLIQTMLRLA